MTDQKHPTSEVTGASIPVEGDDCGRDDCTGNLEYCSAGDCSCHIAPPCSACVDARLRCNVCGDEP